MTSQLLTYFLRANFSLREGRIRERINGGTMKMGMCGSRAQRQEIDRKTKVVLLSNSPITIWLCVHKLTNAAGRKYVGM